MSDQIAEHRADRDAFGHVLLDHLNGHQAVEIIQREDAARTEAVLAAAGFEIHPADTPERVVELDEMPHFKIVTRRDGSKTTYAYADPYYPCSTNGQSTGTKNCTGNEPVRKTGADGDRRVLWSYCDL